MFALASVASVYAHCGNYTEADVLADELVALSDEKGAAPWKAHGMLARGTHFAVNGKTADAIEMLTSGLTLMRSTGTTVYIPGRLAYLAKAYADLGQLDDAWRSIDEALTAVETTQERWREADILQIAGEIALVPLKRDATKAETYFEHALEVARRQFDRSLNQS
jgi:tetratricopeptide (TPR) repeat protein